jgi:hypothetical protein
MEMFDMMTYPKFGLPIEGFGPMPALGFLFFGCSCLPRFCNVGMLHL